MNARIQRGRQRLLQLVLVAAIVALVALLYFTARENLQRLGVQAGFDFLHRTAGFAIAQSLIPYDEQSTILRAFFVALLNTLLLAATIIVFSSLLGLVVGAARMSRNWLVARLGTAYVETFRNVPVLLQIFFWYFVVLRQLPPTASSLQIGPAILNNRGLYLPLVDVQGWVALLSAAFVAAIVLATTRRLRRNLPTLRKWGFISAAFLLPFAVAFGSGYAAVTVHPLVRGRFEYEGGIALMPEFMALAAGLSIYNAAYVAEVIRSGFRAVPRGQGEAASALGLSAAFTFWRVTFPQALTVIVPPMATIYANIVKATSLAAAIAYPEIVSVFVGTVNNLVGQPLEIMAVTLITYATISFAIAALMSAYNRRLERRGFS